MFANVSVAEGQCSMLDIHSFLLQFQLGAPGTRAQTKFHICSSYITGLDIPVSLGQF